MLPRDRCRSGANLEAIAIDSVGESPVIQPATRMETDFAPAGGLASKAMTVDPRRDRRGAEDAPQPLRIEGEEPGRE